MQMRARRALAKPGRMREGIIVAVRLAADFWEASEELVVLIGDGKERGFGSPEDGWLEGVGVVF